VLRATLHVTALCCVNETIACAALRASMQASQSPLVSAALQSILSDEIDHARAGWAHLASASVSIETKRALAPWLPRLLAGHLDALLDDGAPLPGEGYPQHGMLSRASLRGIIASALDAVILPGFERAGIETGDAREWARGRA
jgi:hypothetical protein